MGQSHRLGVLSPAASQELQATAVRLEDLHEQIILDMRSLADQGQDVVAYKATADALGQQVALLNADLITLGDDATSIGAWSARAADTEKQLRAVLSQTGGARAGSFELAQVRGLGWGLGVLLAATAVGAWVWMHRAKSRRRRR